VNLQKLNLQIPVSVAVPVGIAANVCNISVASVGNAGQCVATSNSMALSQAIARNITGATSAGGKAGKHGKGKGGNHQSGLVNVNLQGLNLQAPVSLAVPVAAAASLCNVSVASLGNVGGCNAQSTSTALTGAIAHYLGKQSGA